LTEGSEFHRSALFCWLGQNRASGGSRPFCFSLQRIPLRACRIFRKVSLRHGVWLVSQGPVGISTRLKSMYFAKVFRHPHKNLAFGADRTATSEIMVPGRIENAKYFSRRPQRFASFFPSPVFERCRAGPEQAQPRASWASVGAPSGTSRAQPV